MVHARVAIATIRLPSTGSRYWPGRRADGRSGRALLGSREAASRDGPPDHQRLKWDHPSGGGVLRSRWPPPEHDSWDGAPTSGEGYLPHRRTTPLRRKAAVRYFHAAP